MDTCGNYSAAPAVLYGAKSTEDLHGSLGTQQADCRALAEREGLEVVAEFADEAVSAYSGDRGTGLVDAMAKCEELAARRGEAALIVQHSDRLARGDGRRARHLIEIALWAIKNAVTIMSVQDPQTFAEGMVYPALMGDRNFEDSKRKGTATAAGQRRRWESGKRLGSPIRDGYRLEVVEVGHDGRAVRQPVLDPERAPIWRRIFELAEAGRTPGEIQRLLNGEGVRNRRGNPWRARDIRRGLRDDWYAGRAHAYGQTLDGDHEPLIDPERWERIVAMLPIGRTGGQPPARDDFLLRGIASCGLCGAKLHVRGDTRRYVCSAAREHGTCAAPNIPAELADGAVLDHLEHFIADVNGWLASQGERAERERDRFAQTLEGQRRKLRQLDLRAQRANELADKLLDEGDDETAAAALRKAESTMHDRAQLAEAIAAGEQRLAEWPTVPDVDAALDTYSELRDAVTGRFSGSRTVQELRAHLRASFAHVALDFANGVLHGEFLLNVSDEAKAGALPENVQLSGEAAHGYEAWGVLDTTP
jgi:DNA invertase Pin-like site-specific DNA recombinase